MFVILRISWQNYLNIISVLKGETKKEKKMRKSEKQRGARKIYFEDANMRKLSEL